MRKACLPFRGNHLRGAGLIIVGLVAIASSVAAREHSRLAENLLKLESLLMDPAHEQSLNRMTRDVARLEALLARRSVQSGGRAHFAFSGILRLKSKPVFAAPLPPGNENLFGVFTYEVLEITCGDPGSLPAVHVAHGIRWNGEVTSLLSRPVGKELALDLVPLWWYPKLMRVQRIGGGARVRGALYTPRLHERGVPDHP